MTMPEDAAATRGEEERRRSVRYAVGLIRELLGDEADRGSAGFGGAWDLGDPDVHVFTWCVGDLVHTTVEVGRLPYEGRVMLTGRRAVDLRLVRAVLRIGEIYEGA